ncbi:MAG: 30S ribosomal protein S16 [candidate division Zixibacteria bacterium]|nr:30S ribosomal protein S16 [candidate division Zixibacteria bacterium]
MAVHIRLRRMGKKKQPTYRIVAADSRRARDSRFLEILGTYHPVDKPAKVKLVEDRITYWLDEGAIPSNTVNSLFTQVGFNDKYIKASKGEDVSELVLKATITERPKKTRKMKKAALAKAEDAKTAEATKATEAKVVEEAKATEAKEEEAKPEATEDKKETE